MQTPSTTKSVATGCIVAVLLYFVLALTLLFLLSNWRPHANVAVFLTSWLVALFAGGYAAVRRASNWTSSWNRALIVGLLAALVLLPPVLDHDILHPWIGNMYWGYLAALVLTVPVSLLGAAISLQLARNREGGTPKL